MTFGGTYNNIVTDQFNTVTSLTDQQRAQAVAGTKLTEAVQMLYSIVLYDSQEDSILKVGGLDPANRTGWAEYFFRIPPKVHEFDEPFATSIVNTQEAGKFVESYGSIVKSIRLTGTTGLRPNKAVAEKIPLLGVTQDQLRGLLGADITSKRSRLSNSEASGHDDIIFLRNIFRKYSDLKMSDNLAGRVVMMWRNIKDADYWIVEPEDFKLSQSSSSPLTYEYNISLKTLGKFDFSYKFNPDPLARARSIQNMLMRLQDYSQNLFNVFSTISNQINRAVGFVNFSVSNFILNPILSVINGLNAVKTATFGIVRGLRNTALTLRDNVNQAIEQLVAVPADLRDLIRGLRRTKIICAKILSEPVASESTVRDAASKINRYAAAYQTPGTTTTARRAPSSSPTYIGNSSAPSSTSGSTVSPDEDIGDIAERLLGSRSEWRILVTLNSLRAPYVSSTGGSGVLKPGDTILYPADNLSFANKAVVGTGNPTPNETSNDPNANNPAQVPYGRDLRLRSESLGSSEITDIAINQRGDLASIAGIPNIEQAIRIKFITEQGELPAHPKFGAKFTAGRKATASTFNDLRIDTTRTILSDTRVGTIRDLRFLAVGDKLAVTANIAISNSDSVFSTSFALRGF